MLLGIISLFYLYGYIFECQFIILIPPFHTRCNTIPRFSTVIIGFRKIIWNLVRFRLVVELFMNWSCQKKRADNNSINRIIRQIGLVFRAKLRILLKCFKCLENFELNRQKLTISTMAEMNALALPFISHKWFVKCKACSLKKILS